MDFSNKSRKELVEEVEALRLRLEELEHSEAERRKAEESIGHRFELEKTISSISSRFALSSDIEDNINNSFVDMGKLTGASRVYLFLFRQDESFMDNTHEWCAEGVSPQIDNLRNLPCDMFPWWMAKLHKGQLIHIEDVSKLPKEAASERKILEEQDIKSLLVLPVTIGGRLGGFIGFDNIRGTGLWSEENLAILRISSDIIGNALDHKQAEEQLRESEQRLKILFESAPDAIFLIDMKGNIVDGNRAAEKLVGYKKEELIGKDFTKAGLLSQEEMPKAVAGLAENLAGKTTGPDEFTLKRKDGGYVTLEIRAFPVNIRNQTLVLGIGRDVTERKKAEEALCKAHDELEIRVQERSAELRQSEERFRLAAESTSDLIYEWDMATGRLEWFGDIDGALGFKSGEFPRTPEARTKLIHPDDQTRLADSLKQHRQSTDPIRQEYRIMRKDGAWRYWTDYCVPVLDSEGRPCRWIGACVDITERKKAEKTLQASEQKYHTLVENLYDIVYSYRPDGTVYYVSPNVQSMGGYAQEEIIGRNFMEFVHPGDKQRVLSDYEKIISTEKEFPTVFRLLRKDGSYIYVEDLGRTLKEEGELVGVMGVLRDITDRKKAEEAYRTLVDHSLQGLVIFQDERIVFANQAMAEIIGYTVDEMLTASFQKVKTFVHPEDQALVWSRHQDRLRGKSLPERYELRGIRKDGTICWLELHASRIEYRGKHAVQAAYIDITERKKAEEALRVSEEKYRSIFNTAASLITTVDRNGVIVDCNARIKDILGYKKDEVAGQSIAKIVHPDYIQKARACLNEILVDGFAYHKEFRMVRKDNEVIDVGINAAGVKDKEGKYVGGLCIIQDITERKQTQDALKKAHDELEMRVDERTKELAKINEELKIEIAERRKVEGKIRLFSHAVAGAIDAIAIIDMKGIITYANPAKEKMYGYEKGRLIGKPVSALNPKPEMVEKIMSTIKNTGSWTGEILQQKKNKEIFPALLSLSTVKDEKGNLIAMMSAVRDIAERRRAEEKLLAYQEQLRSMASELSLIEERQRRRIATELHDRVMQLLVFSKMKLDEFQESAKSADLSKPLKEITDTLEQAIQESQTLTYDLGSPTLYELGLEAAVKEWLTEEIGQKHNIATSFKDDGAAKPLSEDISAFLLRAVRELLVNVIKHARAQKVDVSIQRKADKIKICVADDGIGFELANTSVSRDKKRGYGLFSIKEHLKHIGGCLDIKSEQGSGTQAVLTAPLKEKDIKAGS